MDFSSSIIEWYQAHKRDLPWRNTSNPYYIWLSEVILQQTQVKQGLPYYLEFIRKYPTVHDLANADEQDVLNTWQGLGYYSRARNLHVAAKTISKEHRGEFPNTYDGIRALKGVGDYTAAAIASLAFGLPHAVVDGNVYRVLSRHTATDTPINSTEGKKLFAQLAQERLPEKNGHLYNQGIMEIGALVCKPTNPDCNTCPVQESCLARANNRQTQFPVKLKKLKRRSRYFNFICLDNRTHTILEQRTGRDIWESLYQFPLHETVEATDPEKIITHFNDRLPKKYGLKSVLQDKHVLTHQDIYAQVLHIVTEESLGTEGTPWNEVDQYPVPRLIEKFMEKLRE